MESASFFSNYLEQYTHLSNPVLATSPQGPMFIQKQTFIGEIWHHLGSQITFDQKTSTIAMIKQANHTLTHLSIPLYA